MNRAGRPASDDVPTPAAAVSQTPAAVEDVPPTKVHAALGRVVAAFGRGLLRLPWWLQAMVVWAAARVFSALLFVVVDRQAPDGPWGATPLGYFGQVSIWDGQWYRRIHDVGYPDAIPRAAGGAAEANAWAFHPVYPAVVRVVTASTGAPWEVAAPLVALIAGFAAAVLLAALFRRLVDARTALWAVAVVAFCGISPVLQAAYAESLHLALLTAALLLVLQGRALAAAPVVLAMCLTRPAGVPFAAALGITWLLTAVSRLRAKGWGQLPRLLDRWFWLAVWACACALAWPAIAWRVTGERGAYTDTETAWRGTELVPVEPWLVLGARWLGEGWGWLVVVVIAALIALLITTCIVRATLPLVVRVWVVAYGVYLLLFLHPQSSTFRLLLPLAVTAVPLVAVSSSPAFRWALILGGAAAQVLWVGYFWQWSPLPQGGDYPP